MHTVTCSCGAQISVDKPGKFRCGNCGAIVVFIEHGLAQQRSRLPLGTYLSRMLAIFGIRARAGCGCDKRKEALDKLGDKVVSVVSRYWNSAWRKQ